MVFQPIVVVSLVPQPTPHAIALSEVFRGRGSGKCWVEGLPS